MDVRAIRVDLAAALQGQGYRVYDVLPEAGELPLAAVAWPDEVYYHRSIGDGVELELTVTVAVSLNDFGKAQRDIDEAMSTPGLGTALESHPSTAWRSLMCESAGFVRQLDVGAQALAVDLSLRIHA